MITNPNLLNLIQMIKSGGNPEQLLLNLMAGQKNNPFFANLFSLAQSGNTAAIEEIARNLMKEKGLDFDTEFNSFKRAMKL